MVGVVESISGDVVMALPITFRKVLAEFLRVEFKHDNPSYQQDFLLNLKLINL